VAAASLAPDAELARRQGVGLELVYCLSSVPGRFKSPRWRWHNHRKLGEEWPGRGIARPLRPFSNRRSERRLPAAGQSRQAGAAVGGESVNQLDTCLVKSSTFWPRHRRRPADDGFAWSASLWMIPGTGVAFGQFATKSKQRVGGVKLQPLAGRSSHFLRGCSGGGRGRRAGADQGRRPEIKRAKYPSRAPSSPSSSPEALDPLDQRLRTAAKRGVRRRFVSTHRLIAGHGAFA
jgi:hypothetical protein